MTQPVFHAVILGAVQALTEFLPVSSSAHLLVFPWLFGWQHLGLFFDVALHYGTALAVLVYFRKGWVGIGLSVLSPTVRKTEQGMRNSRLLRILVIATLPAAIVGLLARETIEKSMRQPWIAALCLVVFGLVLVAADRYGRRGRRLEDARPADGLCVGLAQVLALVPGVSRSGITIIAGRMRGFDSPDAARFSFLLSMPTIMGAAVLESREYFHMRVEEQPDLLVVGVGTLVSAIAGFLCIHFFLRYLLRSGSFVPFAAYRILLAVLIWSLL